MNNEILLIVCGMLTVFIVVLLTVLALGVVLVFKASLQKEKITQPTASKTLTEEERRKAQRLRQEVINMLSYTGEPQEEIHVD